MRALTWPVIGTVGLLVLGCSGGGEKSADPLEDAEPKGDTLVVGWQSDLGMLLPVVTERAADNQLNSALSMPTVKVDFDCSLKKSPGWASEWAWNDDGTVLSMTFRDDLKWEDGTPLTVEDLKFTYDLVADPIVASPRLNYIEYMKEDARPKIIDATHVEWHFTQPYDRDTQIAHVSLPVVPKHRLEDADRATLRGHELAKSPLAYGPFKLAKWEPNERIILERNDAFTGPDHWKPLLNRVLFRIIPEYATRLIELEAGNIDMMEGVLVEDADRLRESHPEIDIVRRGWRVSDYIAWNLENDLFKDKRVRQALAMGADVDAMTERLLTSKKTGEKYARPSVGTITPALCGVHADDIEPLSHNVEQAKKLLAQAGWRDRDGDGILDKGGKPLSFTLSTNTGNKRRADIQVMFQDQMKKLGVDVQLEKLEVNLFFENMRKHKFEAALAGWSAALFVDPSNVWMCDKPGNPKEFNFTGYCNPEVDALIQKGLREPNLREAAPIWKEMQAKIYEDQPYLFLWWMDEIIAVHERFEGRSIDVLSPRNHLHEWMVPPDKVKYRR